MTTRPDSTGDGRPRSQQRLEARIRGRVQGVGFRYFVVVRARELGLTGWVANEPDGSVRCTVEGDASSLDRLEAALGTGPTGAIVAGVDVVRMPATGGFDRFMIRSGGHSGD